MPFRRRRRVFRARRKRDLIWVTAAFSVSAVAGVPGDTNLVQANQWQPNVNTSFDRAVLLRIVGWLSFRQTADAPTSTAFPAMYGAIYKQVPAVSFDPAAVAGYDDTDILYTFGEMLKETGESEATDFRAWRHRQIDLRVKRKLDSSEAIQLSINTAGGGTPGSAEVGGILRLLIDRT